VARSCSRIDEDARLESRAPSGNYRTTHFS
jgi:hypothetical protein